MKNLKYNKQAVSLSSRLRQAANKFIEAKLKEQGILGISPSHGDILAVLFLQKSCEMGELAKKIGKTKPTLTVLVEKLEANGYVIKERCKNDARIFHVSLTPKTLDLKPVFIKISDELNAKIYKDFSELEIEILDRLLKKALINLE